MSVEEIKSELYFPFFEMPFIFFCTLGDEIWTVSDLSDTALQGKFKLGQKDKTMFIFKYIDFKVFFTGISSFT